MKLYSQLTAKADQTGFEKLLMYILDRQADSRLFQKTQKLYIAFYDVQQLDPGYLSSFLHKPASYINKHNFQLTMHQSLRLRITTELLTQDKGKKDFPFELVY